MKQTYRKLEILVTFGVIDLADFYSASFRKNEIRLQGYQSSDLITKLKKKGFKFKLDACDFIEAKRNNIYITLT